MVGAFPSRWRWVPVALAWGFHLIDVWVYIPLWFSIRWGLMVGSCRADDFIRLAVFLSKEPP
jgi:hypothetical protein